ncbi:MAG TPA: signal peptidase I [Candidatus Omnitrophica bacterium]|nr:signal peptidase I [Candidatus Omnitrophota bacterium]
MSEGKIISGEAKGQSMWPWIKEGDILIIEKIPYEEIKPGDVVVYKEINSDIWIAHRVLRIRKNFLITRGDACLNLKANELVPRDKLIGRVIFVKNHNRIKTLRNTKFVYYLNRYFPLGWWIIFGILKYKLPFQILKRGIRKIRKTWLYQ